MEIISLAPSNTEILYQLDTENELVGVTALCNYPEDAVEKETIGGWTKGIDFDKIRSLNPDLVITSDSLQDKAVKELQDLEVLHLTPETLEEVYESIRKIGKKILANEKAENLIGNMQKGLSQLEVTGNPRIYCEEWMEPPMASGNWIPGLIKEIGGKSFLEEGERSREFELEELKDFDPEYIFLNVCGAGDNLDVQEVLKRESWQEITAVREGNVFVIDDVLLNRPGPRLVEGAKEMAEKINEE